VTAVVVVVDDYRKAAVTDPRTGEVLTSWAQKAIAAHLSAEVTATLPAGFGVRPLTLTIHGATPEQVDHAADLYLGSASIGYTVRDVA
jgi:hypothetical protein